MRITAIYKYDEFLGKGYYLVTETMDKTWYKGDTAKDAVDAFVESEHIDARNITIYEEMI